MATPFRERETKELADLLTKRQSVVLIGMKRVGITGFLKYFLANQRRPGQWFVYLDLNDLIERTLPAFWMLLLTRLVDNVQKSDLPEAAKRRYRHRFIQAIQLQDHFFTLESIRKILEEIVGFGLFTVIFINRFDRLLHRLTPEFLNNLAGLRAPCVFTSFRELPRLNQVFFCHNLYFKPAGRKDASLILKDLGYRHNPYRLLDLCGGYSQYLQLAVIALSHNPKADLFNDEQIRFQSEELYSSLTPAEKQALRHQNYKNFPYLQQTGIITAAHKIFSPLFSTYLKTLPRRSDHPLELTQKETLLFNLLKVHSGQICDREMIIDAVWPETKESGITDWAIERLISRVRTKLKQNRQKFSIITVHTRGYKLVSPPGLNQNLQS